MDAREKAVAYLAEGHALLRAHALYGRSEADHFFALDHTLANLEDNGEDNGDGPLRLANRINPSAGGQDNMRA